MTSDNAAKVALRDYQQQFVARFLGRDFPPRSILVAPTGSGKTTAVLSILEGRVSDSESSRSLYIASSKTAARQLHSRLVSRQLPTNLIDKRAIRESSDDLLARARMREAAVVVISSADFRDSWARDALARLDWDLVVVDDEYLILDSWSLVDEFVDRSAARALALSRVEPPYDVRGNWTLVHWQGPDDRQALPLADYPLRFHIALYSRSRNETALLERADEIASLSRKMPDAASLRDLEAASRSSPYALQAACLHNI